MVELHACNRDVSLAHPWLDGQNVICGYLEKYIDSIFIKGQKDKDVIF